MPHSDRSHFPKTESDAVARAHGGRQAHERAIALGQTELDYEDWITIRTPTFKVWFGDWEAARGVEQLVHIEPLNLDTLEPVADQKAIKAVFKSFAPARNIFDRREVVFPASIAGKVEGHRGFDVKRIARALDRLFAQAVPMLSELELAKAGHKDHTSNIESYHHYVAKFWQASTAYYVRFSVRQRRAKPGKIGASEVHSSFVSQVSVYEESAAPVSSVWGQEPLGITESQTNTALSDAKLAQWLTAGKSQSIRKPVNPQTGEPTEQAIRDYTAR